MAMTMTTPPEHPRRVRHTWRQWQYWRNLGLMTLVAVLIAFYLVLPVVMAFMVTHQGRAEVCCITPEDIGLAYEDVRFATADGLTLHGWFIPPVDGPDPAPAIILTHGDGANRLNLLQFQADVLARHGYAVLVYDLRGRGASEGAPGYGWREGADVLGALAYLQGRDDVDADRIGAYGFSLGAEATLRAAVAAEDIRALMLDGAEATASRSPLMRSALYEPLWWVYDRALELFTGVPKPPDTDALIGQIAPRPVLLVATAQDFGSWELEMGRDLYAAAGEPKDLWEIPEAAHGGGWRLEPEAYAARMTAFFDAALGGPN